METPETTQPFERERSHETRENKEAELSPEAQAAAAMERAEQLVKEVKTSKKQIQNIVLHMGQVQQAITALRKQLALADAEDATSVTQDAATIERLKAQISEYKEELLGMRDDLLRAQAAELAETRPELSESQRTTLAQERVAGMIALVEQQD